MGDVQRALRGGGTGWYRRRHLSLGHTFSLFCSVYLTHHINEITTSRGSESSDCSVRITKRTGGCLVLLESEPAERRVSCLPPRGCS